MKHGPGTVYDFYVITRSIPDGYSSIGSLFRSILSCQYQVSIITSPLCRFRTLQNRHPHLLQSQDQMNTQFPVVPRRVNFYLCSKGLFTHLPVIFGRSCMCTASSHFTSSATKFTKRVQQNYRKLVRDHHIVLLRKRSWCRVSSYFRTLRLETL